MECSPVKKAAPSVVKKLDEAVPTHQSDDEVGFGSEEDFIVIDEDEDDNDEAEQRYSCLLYTSDAADE